jgi:hypothetical protein
MAVVTKIEHMVKLQVFGNNSKTVNNIKIFEKVYDVRRTTDDGRRRKTDDDDGSQVMAIAQMTLWVR